MRDGFRLHRRVDGDVLQVACLDGAGVMSDAQRFERQGRQAFLSPTRWRR
jgi:hypothetical protein